MSSSSRQSEKTLNPPDSSTSPGVQGSLQERIRLALEHDLRTGHLRPGMAIDERALCVRFGASRTPVREALLLLQAKDLVEIRPRSGIYVRQLDAREEGVLARLACSRIPPALQAQLLQALRVTGALAQSKDAAGYAVANARLHEVIYQASGNDYIVEQTRHVRLRVAPYRAHLFEQPGRLARSQSEHTTVVEAICTGHAEQAAQAMRDHICAGGRVFVDMIIGATPVKLIRETPT